MDPALFLRYPPPLDPLWLEHEQKAGLLTQQNTVISPKERQVAYSEACKSRNAAMLASRDSHLAHGLSIHDSTITSPDSKQIRIRTYQISAKDGAELEIGPEDDLVLYYHGGGLRVGDLDSEDLSCRRICKDTSSTVISIDYSLMPDHHPNVTVQEAWDAFLAITTLHAPKTLVVIGSSSGGQLAAQVSQRARARNRAGGQGTTKGREIDGLLLRCPVTCDPTHGGVDLPARFRPLHASFSTAFETSLVRLDPDAMEVKATELPLEAESFEGLPKSFFQLCSNDVYYSDGICYAHALAEAGVDVRMEVLTGWPHTFWLKAPQLERALEAERGMVKGLLWLQEKC